jgi:hypothetical protein
MMITKFKHIKNLQNKKQTKKEWRIKKLKKKGIKIKTKTKNQKKKNQELSKLFDVPKKKKVAIYNKWGKEECRLNITLSIW